MLRFFDFLLKLFLALQQLQGLVADWEFSERLRSTDIPEAEKALNEFSEEESSHTSKVETLKKDHSNKVQVGDRSHRFLHQFQYHFMLLTITIGRLTKLSPIVSELMTKNGEMQILKVQIDKLRRELDDDSQNLSNSQLDGFDISKLSSQDLHKLADTLTSETHVSSLLSPEFG